MPNSTMQECVPYPLMVSGVYTLLKKKLMVGVQDQ